VPSWAMTMPAGNESADERLKRSHAAFMRIDEAPPALTRYPNGNR
jgi:hypothetical protein